MKARVTVTLKNGVLDPQGKAIHGALRSLGWPEVEEVREADLELATGGRGEAILGRDVAAERMPRAASMSAARAN